MQRAGSDKEGTDGIVDGHAYSVLECVNDVAGTDIDLIKMRNPWGARATSPHACTPINNARCQFPSVGAAPAGSGEFECGDFDDDGPGWDRYPQIKEALDFEAADDGIFWVTKAEFFKYYGTLYLSASDMTRFIED